jgi:hypothetical protein
MRFMMLLKSDAKAETGVLPDEALLTAMGEYNEALMKAGVLRGGEGLHESSEGARVRIAGGKTSVVDGPFTESKELVAGYYVLETKTKQEAIEWAKRIPVGDAEAEVELRALWEPEDFPIQAEEQPGGWRDQEEQMRANPPPAPTPDKGPRWVSLLKADAITEVEVVPAPTEELLREMGALMGEMASAGLLVGGDGLRPSSQGCKVRFANRKATVIDGPFAETKEIVAGFTVYRAKTKAEAIEWARRCLQIHVEGTGIAAGEIEVRRVAETEDFPVSADEKPDGWRAKELRMREQLGQ